MRKMPLILLILVLMGFCSSMEYRGIVTKVEFIKNDTKFSDWRLTFADGQEFFIVAGRIFDYIEVGDEVAIYRYDYFYHSARKITRVEK